MPRKLTVSRPGLVLPVAIDPSGREGPTKAQARGPHWRRTSRGLYVPASADGASPEQRIVEAAGALPQVGGVTGWAGLRWAGGYWFEGRTGDGADIRPVPLAVGFHDIRPQVGIEVTQEHLDLQEMAVVDGLPMTTVQRSLGYEMRYAGSVRSAAMAFCMAAAVLRPRLHRGDERLLRQARGVGRHPARAVRDGARGGELLVAPGSSDAARVAARRRLAQASVQPTGVRPLRSAHRNARPAGPRGGRRWGVRRAPPPSQRPAPKGPGPRGSVPGRGARVLHDPDG
jgi:hypothetical protein